MSLGTIRVISLRKGHYSPTPDEQVIRVDRTNPVLGNPHIRHDEHDALERQRVIAAYVSDSEADFIQHGPRFKAVMDIAAKVYTGESVALACWCAPRACHGDWIAEKVSDEVQRLRLLAGEPPVFSDQKTAVSREQLVLPLD